MRKPFVAGNWKMNKNVSEAKALVNGLVPGLSAMESIDRVLCPPFTDLWAIKDLLTGTGIGLGAQNMYWEASGAYTGEIAPGMLAEVCQYVILGHSERRQYFGETDETVNRKIKAALSVGLTPIVCIGESLEEREAERMFTVLETQVAEGLAGLGPADMEKVVIAYEPIWAIGTGKTATADQADEAHRFIRSKLEDAFGKSVADDTRILYGGSVKPNNVDELMAKEHVDGALVGGASLTVDSFSRIVKFEPIK